jgi:hypothetical protein
MRPGLVPIRLSVLTAAFALICGGVAAAGTPEEKTVAYGGVTVRVPASWPVHDLTATPHTCVRYDRPAVYLGAPGPDQDCPAHAVGRAETLTIEPDADPSAGGGARSRDLAPGSGSAVDADQAVTRHLGGVRLSASFADDDTQAASILGSARLTSKDTAVRDAAPRPETRTLAPTDLADLPAPDTAGTRKLEPVATYSGAGFDTCAAPSIATMATWAAQSPFKAAGVYIGGSDRACPDGNLTPSWVRQTTGQGWHLFPVYVGRQAPCWKNPGGGKPALVQHDRRWIQGVEAANDAADRAAYFGLASASTLYFDMEYYPRHVPGCSEDVQAFLSAWTHQLHQRGFLSGVYSSASGAIADMTAIYDAGGSDRPDVAWFAHWDQKAALFGDPTLSDRFWPDHRRIKQYAGGHNETYGGVRVNIDSDWLDASVAAPQ